MQSRRRLRFGVNADPTRKVSAWSFIDVAELAEYETVTGTVVGGADGFDVAWTVGTEINVGNSSGSGNTPRLLYARMSATGALIEGPVVVAKAATGGLACSMAKGSDTVAFACAETSQWEQPRPAWIQLCRKGTSCIRCPLDDASTPNSRPSVVWDGTAFDVVLGGMGASNTELRLVRVSANGQTILAPTTLDANAGWNKTAPAVAWDGGHLVVVYDGIPKISLFDLNGVRTQEPWDLADPGLYMVSLDYDYQLQLTASGYAVWGFGTTEIDTSSSHPYGAQLMTLNRSAPARITSVPGSNWMPEGSIVSTVGELTAIWEDGGDLAFGRFEPATGTLSAEPEYIFQESTHLMEPDGVHCDSTSCYVLAHESVPAYGYDEYRTGVWQLDRASGKVTAPTLEDTVLGRPLDFEGVAAGSGRFVAVVQSAKSGISTTIVSWNRARKSSSDVWPIATTSEDGGYFLPKPFIQGLVTRLLYVDPTEEPQRQYLRTLVDGQWGAPVPIESGSLLQCGDAFILLQQESRGQPVIGKRWRPGVDADFTQVLKAPFTTFLAGGRCSDALVALHGAESTDAAVYSPDGQLVSKRPEWNRTCVATSSSLLFWPDSGSSLTGYRLLPDGTVRSTEPFPRELVMDGHQGVLELGTDTVANVWIDTKDASTHLSLWRLP